MTKIRALIVVTVAMVAIATVALYLASTFPFREAQVVATDTIVRCGAGFYNEGYLVVAFGALAVAGVACLDMVFDSNS